MKTVKEWFEELPDGIRDLALANLKNNGTAVSLSQALAGSFSWDNTAEGIDFWASVYRAAQGLCEYPEIPKQSPHLRVVKSPSGTIDGDKLNPLYKDESAATGLHFESPKPKDPIVESVIKSFRDRSARGIEKYGTTLADNPAKLIEWVNHAQEEVMDLCLYLQRIKHELSQEAVSANKPINPNID